MSLKEVLIFIIIIGLTIWLVHIAPFITEPWKTYGKWVIGVIAIIWVLSRFGVFSAMDQIRVG